MRFLLGVLMLMISGSALATIDVLQFKDEAQEQQFRQLTVWREPEQSRPGFHETFPRSRHTNSYARPWSEWSSNVSRSGRCAPVNV